jgi:putative membrane protein
MFHDGSFYMVGMHGLWWVFWLVLIGLLVFAAWGPGGRRRHGPRETAQDILRRRLASGEITPQQYEERKALLDRDSGGGSKA